MTEPEQARAGPELTWRKVHKITPVLNAWKIIVAIVAVFVFNNVEMAGDLLDAVGADDFPWGLFWLVAVGSVVLLVAAIGIYSTLSWRRMRYAVGADAVHLHRGILFRSERLARLNRIQAVDVVQPLLGRLFGLAQLRIEVAGGENSDVTVAFLREEDAQSLRAEILARASGAWTEPDAAAPTELGGPGHVAGGPAERVQAGGPGEPGVPAAAAAPGSAGKVQAPPLRTVAQAPERQLLEVSAGRLVGSLLRSGTMLSFIVFLAVLLGAAIGVGDVTILTGALPGLFGWGTYLWGRFAGEFGFKVAISPDGVRLRHGLLETRAQTLPPGRVQAIRLTQPLLWRRKGWWRVDVDVAGYGVSAAGGESGTRTVLLPVGERGEALTAMWLILPDLGESPVVLDAALEGDGEAEGFITSPRSARWLDPVVWRRTGLRITRTALFMRTGRLSRSLVVVPHERTQSLGLQQGPFERRLGLADLVAHTVPGPFRARVPHLAADVAGRLLLEQAERARGARAAEGPEEWALRVGVADDARP